MDPVRGKTEHAVVLDQHTDWGADASRDPVRFLQRAIEEIGLERRDFSRTIQALTDEKDEARARAREACQIAVAAVGADGPCNVEEAVRRLADRLADAEKERDKARTRLAEVDTLKRDPNGWPVDGNGIVYAPKTMLDEYATRLSVAEIHLAELRAGVHSACGHKHKEGEVCVLGAVTLLRERTMERDEARHVAKTVALWDLTDEVTEEKYKEAVDTALAYDVGV